MSISGCSPCQSIHGGDIHLSTQHSLTDTMTSINDHSLHERSYIQCK
jgi:phosphoinositide-3-kinase regulatory subunit 4